MVSFGDQIREFSIDFSNLSDQVYRITVISFFNQIIFASPVDTGRFRSNWFVTESIPSTRISSSVLTANQVTRNVEQKVNGAIHVRVFWLTNNLPYAEVIEFGGYGDGPKTINGFSRQAPKGVVRTTARRFSRIFNENADRLNTL